MFQRGHLSEVQHCNQLWKVETPYGKNKLNRLCQLGGGRGKYMICEL